MQVNNLSLVNWLDLGPGLALVLAEEKTIKFSLVQKTLRQLVLILLWKLTVVELHQSRLLREDHILCLNGFEADIVCVVSRSARGLCILPIDKSHPIDYL